MTCLSNCGACKFSGSWPGAGEGHCYMFKTEPVGVCAKFEHVWGLKPMPEEMVTTLDLLKKIKELENCLFQAQEAAKALSEDAARYHWLRDQPQIAGNIRLAEHFGGTRPQNFETLISAAMKATS